mmetsp:Transcript_45215/g.72239  ORF Transcript_45215/g.72239 Transcript_45215/m.72239 type:complete len:124 (+) Transcript_45215:185-556(+)
MNDAHKDKSEVNSELYVLPQKRGGRLRACLACKLIKAEEQWDHTGCDNCQGAVDVYGGYERWTTPSFTGMVALMDDDKSWVAKHQRIIRLTPGLYAISVKGRLSENTNENEHDNENDDDDLDE